MYKVRTDYDGTQHCSAIQESAGKTVGVDAGPSCGGRGEEFSPIDLVAAGLGSCLLLSMGTLALREKLDISGATVRVDVSLTEQLPRRIDAINVTINLPRTFSEDERARLERAAGACPIKHSFHPDVRITASYNYPQEDVCNQSAGVRTSGCC